MSTTNKNKFIPKHKGDLDAVKKLSSFEGRLSSENKMLLLEWMQDMHWEVGHPISDYFRPRLKDISSELLTIFKGIDDEWKWYLIRFLLMNNPNLYIDQSLKSILQRIADHPTKAEELSELDKITKELLVSMGKD